MVELTGKQVLIEDISESLPRHATRRWAPRTSAIRSVTVHHTGGNDHLRGLAAVLATAHFAINPDDPATPGLEGRGWPGIPYHFYIPHFPETRDNRVVVYRCVPDEEKTFHAGRWNNESVAVAFQGTFASRHALGGAPSGHQHFAWLELRGYLAERYGLDAFEFWPHAWRGKPSCPGDAIVDWLLSERYKDPRRFTSLATVALELAKIGFQNLGYKDVGGHSFRRALERFQRSMGIKTDGVFGPATESMLRRALKAWRLW